MTATNRLIALAKTASVLVAVFVASLVTGCTSHPPLRRYEYSQIQMGVATRIVVYAPTETSAKEACTAAYARVAQLEDVMSDYRPDSELMRLCRRANTDRGPIPISADLAHVLAHAQDVARRSNGAFDVTVGPAVTLWRAARKNARAPTETEIQEAAGRIGWTKLHIDEKNHTATFTIPHMRLDLGGIGKGYAGDAAIAVLRRHHLTRALFQSGGDIVLADPPPGKPGWTIDIASGPHQTRKLELHNVAVSTSGDTNQFVVLTGHRYSHVIDPRTARALTSRVYDTVIAPNGVTADALSTALDVLGPGPGDALVHQYPHARAWIYRLDDAAD